MGQIQEQDVSSTIGEPYAYSGLSLVIPDNEDVNFSVKFRTSALKGYTLINIPKTKDDPSIRDAGSVYLGKSQDLRGNIKVYSNLACCAHEEKKIKVEYYVNDILLCEHMNTEEDHDPEKGDFRRPYITIRFTLKRG